MRRFAMVTLLATLVLAVACVASPPWSGDSETYEQLTRAPGLPADFGPGRIGTRTVVLLVIDGVRPHDVFVGVEQERALRSGMDPHAVVSADRLMPNLHRLLSTRAAALGAGGSGIVASGPDFVSLPGYIEILTGSRETRCDNNDCKVRKRKTLAHDFAAGREPASVAVFASWGPLARVVDPDRSMLVSVGRESTNFPELLDRTLFERGESADPSPGYGNYRPDRYTAELAIRYLRTRRPRFMFLSLGDTDEHAHHDDYPRYLDALRFADWTIGEVARTLDELNARGEPTLLMVTTDHGRSAGFAEHGGEWPESAHSWLIAAGDAITARGIIPGEETYALADIAPTIRAVAGLPASPVSPSGVVITELFRPQAVAYGM